MTKRQTALRAVTANSQIDPIFAAIERHKAAAAALNGVDDEKLVEKLADRDAALAKALRATVPTTKAGLLALVRYAQRAGDFGADDGEGRALLATIETAVQSLSDSSSDDRAHVEVTEEMENPLLDARNLSKAMIMALAGKDRAAISDEDSNEALMRLAMTVEDNIDEVFKLWWKVRG